MVCASLCNNLKNLKTIKSVFHVTQTSDEKLLTGSSSKYTSSKVLMHYIAHTCIAIDIII